MLYNGQETSSVLLHGDSIEAMKTLTAEGVHAVVSDPPYGIAFDGREWDTFESAEAFSRFTQGWAREALRLLVPGGAAVICCGQKSFRRDFEAVGYEFVAQWSWFFGTAMPTSDNGPREVSEQILVMRKPGGNAIDTGIKFRSTTFASAEEADAAARQAISSGSAKVVVSDANGNHFLTYRDAAQSLDCDIYMPKVSASERDFGCEDLPLKDKARNTKARNPHPTTKPVKLMRELVRRACPPDGVVLDPFMGSGTTGMACAYEGRQFIGVERAPCAEEAEDYYGIAMRRIAKAKDGKQRDLLNAATRFKKGWRQQPRGKHAAGRGR